MQTGLILLAVPAYAVLIALEIGWAKLRGARTYDAAELLANVSSGLGQQLTDSWLGALLLVPFAYLSTHVAIHHFASNDAVGWALALIGVDFAFYWQHRFSHRVNIIWAAHVVHHQPEHYNLGVALRQPWFSVFFNWVYYQPLAIIGIPVKMFAASVAINLAYQFWLHTRFIGDMGWLGSVLNTPSHHRVHHGRNSGYLDKNYGGVLILWDRLFGTFAKECEPVAFGTTQSFHSRDGVWANFAHWVELYRRSRSLQSWSEAAAVWIQTPEWHSANEPAVSAPATPQPVGRMRLLYACFNLGTAIVAAGLIIAWHPQPLTQVLAVLGILWALAVTGGLLDGRKWAGRMEVLRLITTAAAVVTYGVFVYG
jgi:alkylglycerol monooxygenase